MAKNLNELPQGGDEDVRAQRFQTAEAEADHIVAEMGGAPFTVMRHRPIGRYADERLTGKIVKVSGQVGRYGVEMQVRPETGEVVCFWSPGLPSGVGGTLWAAYAQLRYEAMAAAADALGVGVGAIDLHGDGTTSGISRGANDGAQ